jgi:uncharacterized protein (DUF1330 family)
MTAYIVVDIDVTDPVRYEDYKKLAHASVVAHGGRYIVRGGRCETLEGEWTPSRFVVLEFPDATTARGWWDSPEYRPARDIRHAAARSEMILVEGL